MRPPHSVATKYSRRCGESVTRNTICKRKLSEYYRKWLHGHGGFRARVGAHVRSVSPATLPAGTGESGCDLPNKFRFRAGPWDSSTRRRRHGCRFQRDLQPQDPAVAAALYRPHLYTVWNVHEPDRVAAVWVMQRFAYRDAVFRFIEPFEKVKFGTPFDMPEAAVRRTGTQSATRASPS
jgi:Chromate resistance exported protein